MGLLTRRMRDDEFWALIALLGGRTDGAAMTRLTSVLSDLPARRIKAFAEALSRKLFDLDSHDRYVQPVRDPSDVTGTPPIPLTDDGFLYARCAVIAAGEKVYDRVLADPRGFAGIWDTVDAESLLYVAEEAWETATGKRWRHEPRVSYETRSNRGGWPDGVQGDSGRAG